MKEAIAMIQKKNCYYCPDAINGKCHQSIQFSLICPKTTALAPIKITSRAEKRLFAMIEN